MLFWIKKVRRNPWLAFGIVLFPSVGMWLERYVIIVSLRHRDYLPSSWGMFYPDLGRYPDLRRHLRRLLPAATCSSSASCR